MTDGKVEREATRKRIALGIPFLCQVNPRFANDRHEAFNHCKTQQQEARTVKNKAKVLMIAVLGVCASALFGAVAHAQVPIPVPVTAQSQWYYLGGTTWLNVGPQAVPGGSATVTVFDATTGRINHNADYGLARMGLPPIVFQNATGGTTVYRQLKPGR